jgi:hypothetical protein
VEKLLRRSRFEGLCLGVFDDNDDGDDGIRINTFHYSSLLIVDFLWRYSYTAFEPTTLEVSDELHVPTALSTYGSTALVDLGRVFSFIVSTQSVGIFERAMSPSQGRYLHRTTQTQNKRTQTSIPRVRFEPTIPVLERAKTVDA